MYKLDYSDSASRVNVESQLTNIRQAVIDSLEFGPVVRSVFSVMLVVIAVLSALAGVYGFVQILRLAFQLQVVGAIGGFLFSLIFAAAIFVIFEILWHRALDIGKLGDSPFTVLQIFSYLFRAFGEILLTIGLSIGIGGCLFIWFAQTSPLYLLSVLSFLIPAIPIENNFLGGLLFLGLTSVASFFAFVLSYLFAENSLLLVDIAKSMRILVRKQKT